MTSRADLVEVFLWVAALYQWCRLWRFPTISNDDLYFMTRLKLPGAAVSWSTWWPALADDLWSRNGRSADAVAELIFALGERPMRISMALLCWGISLASWQWLKALAPTLFESRGPRLLAMLALIATPMAMIQADGDFGGNLLFFMSATVGYGGGVILLLMGTYPLIKTLGGHPVPVWQHWMGLALMVLGAWHHEVIAMALLGIVTGCAVVRNPRRWDPTLRWSVALGCMACVARMATPGMWARRAKVSDGQSGLSRQARLMFDALSGFQAKEGYFLYAMVVVILCWTAVVWLSRPQRRRELTICGLMLAFSGYLWRWLGNGWIRASESWRSDQAVGWRWGLPLLLAAALLLVAAVVSLLLAAHATQTTRLVVVPLVAAAFSMAIPVMAGSSYGRPVYFTALLLQLTTIVVAVACINSSLEADSHPLAAVVCVALLGHVVVSGQILWQKSWAALEQNHHAWQEVERQIDEAKAGRTTRVEVPIALPVPGFARDWPAGRTGALERIPVLYDLPPDVEVVYVRIYGRGASPSADPVPQPGDAP